MQAIRTQWLFVSCLSLCLLLSCGASALAQGVVVWIGGGAEERGGWSDKPYRYIVDHSTNGQVAILSTNDNSEWIPTYFKTLGAKDAYNVVIGSANSANQDDTYNAIKKAGAVFIKGGDQAEYVNFWQDSKTEQAIKEIFQAGGAIAGTSAGAHVLSDVIYDAKNGSVYPEEALRDPYDKHITFTTDFLKLVPGSLVDSHFTQRGRLPRLVAFIARQWQDNKRDMLGIGVDDQTALCINADGIGEVFGQGAITFLYRTDKTVSNIERGMPPTYTHIHHDQLTEGFKYSLSDRKITFSPLSANPAGPAPATGKYQTCTLKGDDTDSELRGEYYIGHIESSSSLYNGELTLEKGDDWVTNAIIMTKVFSDADYIENTVGGVQWGLAKKPHGIGIYLDEGAKVVVSNSGVIDNQSIGTAQPAVMLLDSYGVDKVDFSTYKNKPLSPRQSVAMTNIRLHLITAGMSYDAVAHDLLGGQPNPARCGLVNPDSHKISAIAIILALPFLGLIMKRRTSRP